jgi:hypothetical protein
LILGLTIFGVFRLDWLEMKLDAFVGAVSWMHLLGW